MEKVPATTDPVCGMAVDEQSARSSTFQGHIYFFCSESCQKKFDIDPAVVLERVAQRQEGKATRESGEHNCCSHSDSEPKSAVKPFADSDAIYTCPMHPQVQQVGPGDCPICGMDLEPKFLNMADHGDEQQYRDMRRRFGVGAVLSLPLLLLAMGPMVGWNLAESTSNAVFGGLQLALATPVVFWCGWPLLVRGAKSFRSMNLNMFSLISVGTLAAYLFSLFVVIFPALIPQAFFEHGKPPLYFEAAAVIMTLVLLGQVLELRARQQTGGAIRELMQLAPEVAHRLTDDGEQDVALGEVKKGDKLRVRPGEKGWNRHVLGA